MNILVCISHVPDTTSKIKFKDNNTVFDTEGVQFVINPNDDFGLTRAIWFKEKNDAKVTVITVGDSSCEPTLRKALAKGADDAIRIDALPKDGFFVAKQLYEIAKKNTYDLIIAGRESIDYNGCVIPGALAALLNIPFVNKCIGLEIDGNTAKAVREIEGGKEILCCKLPIIIGGQKGLVHENDLKIPNIRGIMSARQKPLEVIEPIDIEAKTTVKSFESLPPKGDVKMIPADNLDSLIDILHKEAKVI